MSIVFEIKTPPVARTSSKGNAYKTQVAYGTFFDRDGNPEPVPRRVELMLFKDDPGYAPGKYTLAPTSFGVGQGDRLELARVRLAPVSAGTSEPGTAAPAKAGAAR